MSEAIRYTPNYSANEYRTWQGDWELWHGVPVSMSPSPTAKHQRLSFVIASILNTASEAEGCDCTVVYETDWQVDETTVVRPDISVLCSGMPEQFIDYSPSLIVEVLSPATAGKDRTEKRALYRREGVQVYMLVDPENETIDVLNLVDGDYRSTEVEDEVLVEWKSGCSARIIKREVFEN